MCAYDEDLPPFDSAQRSLRKNTMLNILTEPVIRLDLSGGVRKDANLPEVFAALVSDKVVSFPALRPHQRHAWHAFLVQLGRWPCTGQVGPTCRILPMSGRS